MLLGQEEPNHGAGLKLPMTVGVSELIFFLNNDIARHTVTKRIGLFSSAGYTELRDVGG